MQLGAECEMNLALFAGMALETRLPELLIASLLHILAGPGLRFWRLLCWLHPRASIEAWLVLFRGIKASQPRHSGARCTYLDPPGQGAALVGASWEKWGGCCCQSSACELSSASDCGCCCQAGKSVNHLQIKALILWVFKQPLLSRYCKTYLGTAHVLHVQCFC